MCRHFLQFAALHRADVLLLIHPYRAVQGGHFCQANFRHSFCIHHGPSTSASSTPPAAQQTSRLPDRIERKFKELRRAMAAEEAAVKQADREVPWQSFHLKCTQAVDNYGSTLLTFSTREHTTIRRYKLETISEGRPVELKPVDGTKWAVEGGANLFGFLQRHFNDHFVVKSDSKFSIEEKEILKVSFFQMRKVQGHRKFNFLFAFLDARHKLWPKMPGYQAMLYAFKCRKLPKPGLQDAPIAGLKDLNLDSSQRMALSAALNLKERPIVVINGPPGTGKTRLLVEYLRLLVEQGKRVVVFSPSTNSYLHLASQYCQLTGRREFLTLHAFNWDLAERIVGVPAISECIQARCIHDKYQQLHWGALNPEQREFVERNGHLVFANLSGAVPKLFARFGLHFDVVVLDDAQGLEELSSWRFVLPSASILRLFGDIHQLRMPVHSELARKLQLDNSLLQRLNEEFGPELNFHLKRQYRSNEAIQEWPNRLFYGPNAAEADQSVRQIRLKAAEGHHGTANTNKREEVFITDPLVLVDTAQLAGHWRQSMFKPAQFATSSHNWGEALLIAAHLKQLLKQYSAAAHASASQPPYIAAYSTVYVQQRHLVTNIFSQIAPAYTEQFKKAVYFNHRQQLYGQQLDVILRSHVCVPSSDLFTDATKIKLFAFEMGRARKQFIYIADSRWLERCSPSSRLLLDVFREKGRVIGPNELLRLKPGQFESLKGLVETKSHFEELARDKWLNQQ